MPRYLFTGSFETVLHGLAHGVNAVLHRSGEDDSAEHGQPDGSTVVAQPGDEVETDEAYPHAQLVNVETGEPDQQENESSGTGEPMTGIEVAPGETGTVSNPAASDAPSISGQHAADDEPPEQSEPTADTTDGQE